MWKRTLVALPVAMLTLVLLNGAEGIDKGELECEEAVKHLLDCCPNDAPIRSLNCYAGRFCDDRRADLAPEHAVCLRDASCDDLFASGACGDPRTRCLP